MDGIVRVIAATDLDGLIVSNTTISRDAVPAWITQPKLAAFPASRCSISRPSASPRCASARRSPSSASAASIRPKSALAKFEAGANAIQLYTALVFGGLDLLDRIKRGLVSRGARRGQGQYLGTRRPQDRAVGEGATPPPKSRSAGGSPCRRANCSAAPDHSSAGRRATTCALLRSSVNRPCSPCRFSSRASTRSRGTSRNTLRSISGLIRHHGDVPSSR